MVKTKEKEKSRKPLTVYTKSIIRRKDDKNVVVLFITLPYLNLKDWKKQERKKASLHERKKKPIKHYL